MTDCKRTFISNLGSDLSRDDESKFERKLQYCREILGLLDKFHPGCNYERGNRTERFSFQFERKLSGYIIYQYLLSFNIFQLQQFMKLCPLVQSSLKHGETTMIETKNIPSCNKI